jgi:hypothetical protein
MRTVKVAVPSSPGTVVVTIKVTLTIKAPPRAITDLAIRRESAGDPKEDDPKPERPRRSAPP